MIGSKIGSYRITKLLGEGGMGTVYQATDNIQREVAIKVLRPHVARDDTRLERFRSEAMALGRLHHPNITSLFHLLEEDATLYMVMEFVEGQTLDELLRQFGVLPPHLALDILIDGLHGFEHAHSRGVIHRDIKASNLMVSNDGTTKIMDFGVARMDGSARLTQTGKPIGTLEYMSPEQVRGAEQDARSDIYSLGILLHELLTGRVPFTDTSDFELMRAHLEKAPPSARFLVPSLPAAIDDIIAKALAKDPIDRFQNVDEMRAALEAVAQELPVDTAPLPTTPQAKSQSVRATIVEEPDQHYAIVPEEDRYGTRLVGSPLPAPSSPFPVAPPPPQPVVAALPASVGPSTKTANRPWLLFVLGGIVLWFICVLAFALLRPTSKPQNSAGKSVAPTSVAKPGRPRVGSAQPQSKVAVHAPASSRTRNAVPRSHVVEKPKRHRVVRRESLTRTSAAKPKRVKRPQQRPISGVQERDALRSLIKGD